MIDTLYDVNWNSEIRTLFAESRIFGISLFGDGETIKTVPMVNYLDALLHNSFILLDVFDCSKHCSGGGRKDAHYIENLFLPLVKDLEDTSDFHVSVCYMTVSCDICIYQYFISTYSHLLYDYTTGKKT